MIIFFLDKKQTTNIVLFRKMVTKVLWYFSYFDVGLVSGQELLR